MKTEYWKRFYEVFYQFKKPLLITFGLIILNMCLGALAPIFFGKMVSAITESVWKDALVFIAIAFIAYLLMDLCAWTRAHYELRKLDWTIIGETMLMSLRKMLTLSIGQHVHEHSGKIYSIISRGEGAILRLLSLFVHEFAPTLIKVVVYLTLLTIITPLLSLVSVMALFVFIVFSVRAQKKSMPALKDIRKSSNEIDTFRQEGVRMATTVIINSRADRTKQDHEEKILKHKNKHIGHWSSYYYSAYPRFFILALAKHMNMVVGVWLVYSGSLDIGTFVTALYVSNVLMTDISAIGGMQRTYLSEIPHVMKYIQLIDVKPIVCDRESAVTLKDVKKHIRVTDLRFRYEKLMDMEDPDDENSKVEESRIDTLLGVSLTIPAQKRVAFVGHSGSGKTTLARLLVRAYDPQEGTITLDDMDLRDIKQHSLHHLVGFVEQNVMLCSGSIKDNVLFGLNGDAQFVTETEMEDIKRVCRIDQFWHRLTDGWDTKIGENGVQLSGGERQRIAIARALIRKPRILILDEATSSLDTVSERIIQQTIDSLTGITTIIIAHRLSTVRKCDTIFVFEKGRVAAEGSHDELMKTSPTYRELVGSDEFYK